MAAQGFEGGDTRGLGWIEGTVEKMRPANGERLPHVGWNEVHYARPPGEGIFRDVLDGRDFYFVHSYHFRPSREEIILGRTPYSGGFVSAVRQGHLFGTQFHPEKSQRAGFQVLRNFISM